MVALSKFPKQLIDSSRYWYLSGPMAGYDEHNFPAFRLAAEQLRKGGLFILSPHEIEHSVYEGTEEEIWAQYLAKDLELMITGTQGIILLPGWPQSKGAVTELDANLRLHRPVYYYDFVSLVNMNKREAV